MADNKISDQDFVDWMDDDQLAQDGIEADECAAIEDQKYDLLKDFQGNAKSVGQLMCKTADKITVGAGTLIQKDGDDYLMLTSATMLWGLKDGGEGQAQFFLQRCGLKECAGQFAIQTDSVKFYSDFTGLPEADNAFDLCKGTDFALAKVTLLGEGTDNLPVEFPKISTLTVAQAMEKIGNEEKATTICYPSINPNKPTDKENKKYFCYVNEDTPQVVDACENDEALAYATSTAKFGDLGQNGCPMQWDDQVVGIHAGNGEFGANEDDPDAPPTGPAVYSVITDKIFGWMKDNGYKA